MSRDDGFPVADVAVGLLDDPKVKALWRGLSDHGRMCHALVLHEALILASWRHGARVTIDEAAPVWLVVDDDLVAELIRVRLLDRTRRLPLRSWNGWFGPANARREARREAGRVGGLASGKGRRSTPERSPKQPLTIAEPDRSDRTGPSLPSDRTVLPARAREEAPSKNGATGEATGFESVRQTAAALGLVK